VAASRDPDAIAREIEQTRSELADAIDAIATMVNPKRVAARGAEAVKTPTGRAVAIGAAVLLVAVLLMKRRSR
jgi:hypothetical protein